MTSATGQKQKSGRSERSATSRGRRQEYIDTAAAIFYRRGYDTATIGDLARALDVTKAAVYYYVDSKEDLLYEIIREMHVLNLANLETARAGSGPAAERLWNYFAGHARINMEHLEKATVVYRDLDHLSADRRLEIVTLRDATEKFVRGLLSLGIYEGTICSMSDVELTSIQMFTTVNALYMWYQPGGPRGLQEVARGLADFVVGAVACTGPADTSCPRHHPPSGR